MGLTLSCASFLCFDLLFSTVKLICKLHNRSKSLLRMRSGALLGGLLEAHNLASSYPQQLQPVTCLTLFSKIFLRKSHKVLFLLYRMFFVCFAVDVRRHSPGGNLSFQDTGLCHSNRKSTTHKSGEISQKYTHKSGEISQKYTHKSGEFMKNHTHKSGNAKTAHQ